MAGSGEPGEESERRFTRGRRSRGHGLRKTTGCLTCRRRHVKCDEKQPTCGGCLNLKQTCTYAQQRQSRRASPPQSSRNNQATGFGVPASSPVSQDHNSDLTVPIENDERRSLTYSSVQDRQDLGMSGDQMADPFGNGGAVSLSAHLGGGMSLQSAQAQTMTLDIPPVATPQGLAPPSLASSVDNFERATARWVGLLLQDADMLDVGLAEINFEADGVNIFGNSAVQSPVNRSTSAADGVWGQEDINDSPRLSNPYLRERVPHLIEYHHIFERQEWHSDMPLQILPYEHPIFKTFVCHISLWLDLFDPQRPFGTLVPHLAIHNVGLMNAILALSARHLALKPPADESILPGSINALQYYNKTLHYIRKAMHYDTYKTSLELLATSLIISAYEMLDGSTQDWQRHLQGVFWIQRSQVIHGDSQGLRQAVWWAWLCQDVWAAFREKRKPFTFWKPVRMLGELNPYELAARSVYFFAQVVGYCSYEETEASQNDPHRRISEADALNESLEDWKKHLTVEFQPLSQPSSPDDVFNPIWINPPAFAVALQLYYCSRILLLLHRPLLGGLEMHVEMRKCLTQHAGIVCGIAMTQSDSSSAVMCSQSLFIAGLSLEDKRQRKCVLQLLESCRQRTGWSYSFGEDLKSRWEVSGGYDP